MDDMHSTSHPIAIHLQRISYDIYPTVDWKWEVVQKFHSKSSHAQQRVTGKPAYLYLDPLTTQLSCRILMDKITNNNNNQLLARKNSLSVPCIDNKLYLLEIQSRYEFIH